MAAIEVVSGQTTATGTGATAVTLNGGTLTVRNFTKGSAWLLTAWRQAQTQGALRLRSPRFHDFVNGITCRVQPDWRGPLIPLGFPQRLYAQDTITMENFNVVADAAGDISNSAFLVYYEELDGANGRFIDLATLENRMVNVFTTSHALVGAVTGVYGAAQAINAGTSGDTFKANTDYALLGITTAESAAGEGSVVRFTGVDTGNLGIGVPCSPENNDETRDFFIKLTKAYGKPMIPVVNSANKGGTVMDVLNDENANTVQVAAYWAELR